MLSLRQVSSRRLRQSSQKLLNTRLASTMEGSSSRAISPKSTSLKSTSRKPTSPKSTPSRSTTPNSERSSTPKPLRIHKAKSSEAYVPPQLRNKTPLPSTSSEIDDLSQSIDRVSLNDSTPSVNKVRGTPNISWHQRGSRKGGQIYGDYSKRAMADKHSKDPRTQPSKASGGVPDPTPAYLALSAQPYVPLPEPQHLLVVIDLNGTLLHRPNRKNPTKFVARPNTLPFLRYCIDTFTVVIWSSARPDNVRNMCDAILTPSMREHVAAICGREKFNFTPTDYNANVQCYKRLSTLWRDETVSKSHPEYETGGRWDQTNTVLVDDSITKGRSEPFNLIEIPEFLGNYKEMGDILPQVHDYLNRLAIHSNVSSYLRTQPFSTAQQNLAQQTPAAPQQNQLQQRPVRQPKSTQAEPEIIGID